MLDQAIQLVRPGGVLIYSALAFLHIFFFIAFKFNCMLIEFEVVFPYVIRFMFCLIDVQ